MCFWDPYFIEKTGEEAKAADARSQSFHSSPPTHIFFPPLLSTFLLTPILLTSSRKSNQAGSNRADCWGRGVTCGFTGNLTRLQCLGRQKRRWSVLSARYVRLLQGKNRQPQWAIAPKYPATVCVSHFVSRFSFYQLWNLFWGDYDVNLFLTSV